MSTATRDIAWKKFALTGRALIEDPQHNKGLSFSSQERVGLNLHGLLPCRVETLEHQADRVMWMLNRIENNLEKYQFIMNINDINSRLFYYVLSENVSKIMPIVYTPTVGLACQKFGYIFQTPRGMWITINDAGHVYQMLKNWPEDDVRAVCFTDGERILGLGDLGAFGMGIPIGKLALYTACAGIKPHQLLPVMLDVGTNNKELREDKFYIGVPSERDRTMKYDLLVEEFMNACVKRWGRTTLIQFEDFGNRNATRLLRKHQENFLTFNDDIQGTASVGLAGLYSALKMTNTKLSDHTIVFMGAGSAGIGIADLICKDMVESEGLTIEDARKHIYLRDSRGLVVKDRSTGGVSSLKEPYAHEMKEELVDLAEIVTKLKATVLIGVSGQGQVFTQEVCEAMAANCKRPVIMPMSNPTHKAECSAEDAFKWTKGNVIFASGSPFPPVQVGELTVVPSQGNNAYIFPGLALGVIATKCLYIPDSFFITAAKALADLVTDDMMKSCTLYPPLDSIRECSIHIACAVGKAAYDMKLAMEIEPKNMRELVESVMYDHKKLPSFSNEVFESKEEDSLNRQASFVFNAKELKSFKMDVLTQEFV